MNLRMLPVALALVLLTSGARAEPWMESAGTACRVSVPSAAASTTVRWQGECVAGKAQGAGILTSSEGGLLRGEFRDGVPFDAHGFWPLQLGSSSVLAQYDVQAGGVPFQSTLDLPSDQGAASPISSAPLVGAWQFLSGNGRCRERHDYHADGSYRVASGAEVIQGAFALMRVGASAQVFGLLRSTLASNGEPDCTGSRSPPAPDETYFFYLRQETPDQYSICRVSKAPLRCIGSLTRASAAEPPTAAAAIQSP